MDVDGMVHFTTTLFALICEVSGEHLIKGRDSSTRDQFIDKDDTVHFTTTLFALIREVSRGHLMLGQ